MVSQSHFDVFHSDESQFLLTCRFSSHMLYVDNYLSDNFHFSSLEKRVVFSLAALYGVRMLGLFMVIPVLAIKSEEYPDSSPIMLGLALGIYGLAQAVLQVPLGMLSDRIGRRPVIIGGLIMFSFGSLIAAGADSLLVLTLGRALQGTGAIVSVLMAMVTDYTSERNRTTAMAVIGASIGFSFLLAMIAGPIIASIAGLFGIFSTSAVLGIIGVMLFISTMPTGTNMVKNRETEVNAAHIITLLKMHDLIRLNIGIFVLHFVLMASFLVIPDLLANELNFSIKNLWWVYFALLGGGFIMMLPALVTAEDRGIQKSVLIGSVVCMAVSALALAIHRDFWVTAAALLLFFGAFNLLEALLPSWASKVCPAGQRGTAMGIYATFQFGGTFLGGVLGGVVIASAGINALFLTLAGVLVFWAIFALWLESPRTLQTFVLSSGDMPQHEFAERILNIHGVEDILAINGEKLAYAKVDRKVIDMSKIEPYFNCSRIGE